MENNSPQKLTSKINEVEVKEKTKMGEITFTEGEMRFMKRMLENIEESQNGKKVEGSEAMRLINMRERFEFGLRNVK